MKRLAPPPARPVSPRSRGLHCPLRGARRGLTLVEILIVMMIIGVLVGLVVPALVGVRRRAVNSQATAEVSQLAASVDRFQAKYNCYPPSFMKLRESTKYQQKNAMDLFSVEYLRRIFPNIHLEMTTSGTETPLGESGRWNFMWCDDGINSDGSVKNPGDPTTWSTINNQGPEGGYYICEGDEMLVFWLGGIASFKRDPQTWGVAADSTAITLNGFCTNPANPSGVPAANIPSSNNRTAPLFEFTPDRLFVRAAIPGYGDSDSQCGGVLNQPEHCWNYPTNGSHRPPKLPSFRDAHSTKERPRPVAYFSSYEGRGYRPFDCVIPTPASFGLSTPPSETDIASYDPDTYDEKLPYFQMTYPFASLKTDSSQLTQNHARDLIGPNPYTVSDPAPVSSSVTFKTALVPFPTGAPQVASQIMIEPFKPHGYQIIAPGADGMFGSGGRLGAYLMNAQTDQDYDNISNVSGGKLVGDYNRDLLDSRQR